MRSRCAGANHDSAGAIRVMVNSMQLGQAAATVETGGDVRGMDIGALQGHLIDAGAAGHLKANG